MGAFRRIPAASGFAILIPLLSPARSAAQDPSPFGRRTVSVLAVGGRNFVEGRHGLAEVAAPSIDAGKFVSRRLEVGLDFHPWIGIRQPVNDNGDGGYKNTSAFALDVYGRWYPGRFSAAVRPYVEAAVGPFYSSRPVPAAGSRFNFLTQVGAGVTLQVSKTDPWSVVVGYRLIHISNAHTYERNPSWDFNGVVFGLRKFMGSGSELR